MDKYNINYLNKNELIYELTVRDQNIKYSNVDSLRKQLRSVLHILPDAKNLLGKINTNQELSDLDSKLTNIQMQIENSADNIEPLTVAKIKSKLKHVDLRIAMLNKCKISETHQMKLKSLEDSMKQLMASFEEVKTGVTEEDLTTFEENLHQSIIEDEAENIQGEGGRLLQPQGRKKTEEGAGKEEIARGEDEPKEDGRRRGGDEDDQRTGPTREQPTDFHTSTPKKTEEDVRPTKIASENREVKPQNPTETQVSIPTTIRPIESATTSLFNKLPNPILKLLDKFPISNGLEIQPLLEFLGTLSELRLQTKLTESEIYQLLPGYATAPLLNKIIEGNCMNKNLDQLHQEILDNFIPVTLKEKLKQDLIYRPQRKGEPLSIYIADIKKYHDILKTQLSEKQIVSFIKNGINPETRTKMIFEKNPNSYQDLDELCINANNIGYCDYVRQTQEVNTYVNRPSLNNDRNYIQNRNHTANHTRHGNPNVHRKQNQEIIKCYRCNKNGHIAKNCYTASKNL